MNIKCTQIVGGPIQNAFKLVLVGMKMGAGGRPFSILLIHARIQFLHAISGPDMLIIFFPASLDFPFDLEVALGWEGQFPTSSFGMQLSGWFMKFNRAYHQA